MHSHRKAPVLFSFIAGRRRCCMVSSICFLSAAAATCSFRCPHPAWHARVPVCTLIKLKPSELSFSAAVEGVPHPSSEHNVRDVTHVACHQSPPATASPRYYAMPVSFTIRIVCHIRVLYKGGLQLIAKVTMPASLHTVLLVLATQNMPGIHHTTIGRETSRCIAFFERNIKRISLSLVNIKARHPYN